MDHLADPDCRCERCKAVYAEWAAQAEGFQKWYDQGGYRYFSSERKDEDGS